MIKLCKFVLTDMMKGECFLLVRQVGLTCTTCHIAQY